MLPHRLLLALLGGVALCLAFPGYDVWWLAPVGCGARVPPERIYLTFRPLVDAAGAVGTAVAVEFLPN